MSSDNTRKAELKNGAVFVKTARAAIGMSQADLAGATGFTRDQVVSYEYGRACCPDEFKGAVRLEVIRRMTVLKHFLEGGKPTPEALEILGEIQQFEQAIERMRLFFEMFGPKFNRLMEAAKVLQANVTEFAASQSINEM